jgi:hypothetical protein
VTRPRLEALRRRAAARRRVQLGRGVRLGDGVRLDAAPGARIELQDGCALGDGTRILAREGTVTIGRGAVLGERCTLVAHAGIAVGAGARFGDGAMVVDFDHRTEDPEAPIRLQGLAGAPVHIGARAAIGHGASILRGVTVGDGAIIGAHAVVTRDVPAGGRADGVPAAPAQAEAARPSTATSRPG